MGKVSGITTLALLKANFDEGMDYLEMFMPFILNIIWEETEDLVELGEVQKLVKKKFDINIPPEVVSNLLNKAKRRGAIKREAGKYFKIHEFEFDQDLNKKQKSISRQLNKIGTELNKFLKVESIELESDDDALAILFKFLSNQELELLLDIEYENKPIDSSALKSRQMRAVAKFIKDVCLKDPILADYLDNILTGFVLQNALLLKNIATPSKVFDDLQIFLDSGFLLGLLGWKGAARELANKDTVELLKATNAHIAVFEPTVDELKRILFTYERNLGTQKGRERLWQGPITRHVLAERLTPSDIKQAISLIEDNLQFKYGISIHTTPERKADYTMNEEDLAKRLGEKDKDKPSNRITHDIDCVAAILTLRKGNKPKTLDNTKAIFMTGSSTVVNIVKSWYEESKGSHVSPIIHHLTIANIAWLKRPDLGANLKINELVALCTAALKPKPETWSKFLDHLRKLEKSGEITSAETVTIITSNFIESELVAMEDHEEDVDSSSVSEIVDRVKHSLISDSKKREEDLKTEIELKDESLSTIDSNINNISNIITNILFVIAALLIILGSFYILPGVSEWLELGITGYIVASMIAIFTAISLITGFRLSDYKHSLSGRIRELFTKVIKE